MKTFRKEKTSVGLIWGHENNRGISEGNDDVVKICLLLNQTVMI